MCAINAFYFINTNFYMRMDICIKYVYLRTKKRTRIYAESSRKTISLFFSFNALHTSDLNYLCYYLRDSRTPCHLYPRGN